MFSSANPVCQETAGFLFAHSCKNPATQTCAKCSKSICTVHMRPVDTWRLSPSPSGERPPGAMSPVCVGCRRELGSAADRDPTANHDDPYFYSGSYYHDYYGYDHVDRYSRADRDTFATPAGTASTMTDTGAESWENDFEAS
jgi:hypothetical protein